jgi:hypothetical protein
MTQTDDLKMVVTHDRQERQPITACKQYCLAAGATQGNIAYTQTVMCRYNRKQLFAYQKDFNNIDQRIHIVLHD